MGWEGGPIGLPGRLSWGGAVLGGQDRRALALGSELGWAGLQRIGVCLSASDLAALLHQPERMGAGGHLTCWGKRLLSLSP